MKVLMKASYKYSSLVLMKTLLSHITVPLVLFNIYGIKGPLLQRHIPVLARKVSIILPTET